MNEPMLQRLLASFENVRSHFFLSLLGVFAVLFGVMLSPGPAFGQQSAPPAASSQAAESPQDQQKTQRLLRSALHAEDGEREGVGEGPEFLLRRQQWFFRQRAYPLGFIPQGARERALEEMDRMIQREISLGRRAPLSRELGLIAPPPSGPLSNWTAIGPQPTNSPFFAPSTSGRVTALAVNPNNPSNVYLGGADGGLWITTDGSVNWTPLTDNPTSASGLPSIAVGALAVDPTTCVAAGICTTVYVATGEDNFAGDNIYGEGILKCTVTAGAAGLPATPPTAACTQDTTFRAPSPLDQTRGGPMIGALAVNRLAGENNILLAGVRGRSTALPSGVYCSDDSGLTWKAVFGIPGIVGTDAVFAGDGTAFVALGFPFGGASNGIYKSKMAVSSCAAVTDTGGTLPGGTGSNWTKQALPLATANVGRIALAIAPSSDSTVYAAVADSTTGSSNLLGVAKTTNGGTTWSTLSGQFVTPTTGFCNPQCWYDIVVAVSPTNPNVVYAGGAARNATLIRSTDGGTTWAEVSNNRTTKVGLHVDTHAIGFSKNGDTIYVGNDGGVWKATTNDAGAIAWNNLNATLNVTQFYPGISIHPSTPFRAYGGTQDNGVQIYKGAPAWDDAGLGCDGGFTVVDPAIPSNVYGECQYVPKDPVTLTGGTLLIGETFENGDFTNGSAILTIAGIDSTDRGDFIPPLVGDAKKSGTLYFGTCRVWQTTDGGLSWKAISPDLTDPAVPNNCSQASTTGGALKAISVAPSDSLTLYTGSDTGLVMVTTNGGATWTNVTSTTLSNRVITSVAVDPLSSGTAYVTFSGFGTCAGVVGSFTCDQKGHVFKTVNGTAGAGPTGTVWTDISGSGLNKLPDIPVNDIVVDPDDPARNTLYVGTDIGAFFTKDGGVNWSPLGAAGTPPRVEILSLKLHEPSRTLRAATHGRGVWDLNLGGQAAFGITSIAPFFANAPSTDITTFTVNGNGFTANSKIRFAINGTTVALTPTSSTLPNQLVATVPGAQLQLGGVAQVSVTDPAQANPTNTVIFTVLNAIPTISTIAPTSTTAGTGPLTVTVTGAAGGSNFVSGPNGTQVLLNGTTLRAADAGSITPNSLTFTLNTADLAVGRVISVDTFNPQPGGGADTNPMPPTLTVNNPVPAITTLSPASTSSGGPPFTLMVNGSNFNAASVVNFNGSVKPTMFVSSVQLTALISAGDIATAGTKPVTVVNPAPGGGTASTTFTVNLTGDFTVTPQAPTSVTVNAGLSATYTIQVGGTGGFASAVNLTCSLPATATQTSCSFNPASVTPSGATPATSTLTVTTTSRAFLPPPAGGRRMGPRFVPAPLLVLATISLALLFFVAKTRRQRLAASVPLAAVLLLLVLEGAGCGGGSSSPPTAPRGTPAGTYPVTVTGTSANVTHTSKVTLVVN